MGRRRSSPRKRRIGPGHNEANRRTSESRGKSRMLDQSIEHRFRYFAEEEFKRRGIEAETWRPILQNVWARGVRQGIDEAKDFIKQMKADGTVEPEIGDFLLDLVRRHSTVR